MAGSYNPFVRCGAVMAVGLSCIGKGDGNKEASKLINTLLTDQTNFVRQAAFIAGGFIYNQSNSEEANKFRESCRKKAGEKREEVMTKKGAILSCGVMDIAGGNASISMLSLQNNLRTCGVVGLAMFLQFWY